jgi:predicted RNase H-like HicB family nuclease
MEDGEENRNRTPEIFAPEPTGQGDRVGSDERRCAHRDPKSDNEADRSEAVKYAVIFEQGPTSVGVTVPDLPGCFAVARDLPAARTLIAEAIAFHIESLREDGLPVPEPTLHAEDVNVAA